MTGHEYEPRKTKKVAQIGDSMFERNLILLVSKGKVLKVETSTSDHETVFVAGLDEQWIQFVDASSAAFTLVNRSHLVSIQELSNTIEDLVQEKPSLGEMILEKISRFRAVATAISQKRGES